MLQKVGSILAAALALWDCSRRPYFLVHASFAMLAACGSSGGEAPGSGDSGSQTATGGATGSGGATGKGGATGSGGATGKGGATGTGGATGSGGATGPDAGDCTTPPLASELVGWAAVSGNGVSTTTGGGSATPTTVTSLAELQSAVSGTTPAVVHVRGTLVPGAISVGSNKTIVGVCGAEVHGHLELSGSANVIIRNITIVGYAVGDCALDPAYKSSIGCSSGADAVSVQKNAHHVWFDHCDISDGTDGNLDITNAADYVTVSYTKFHYTPRTDPTGSDSTGASGHRFSNLVGGTDTPTTYDDANALNVTWHHDWWADNVMERQARVRFGHNHFFSDYWSSAGDNSCVRAGTNAHIYIENGAFAGVKNPHEFNSAADQQTANIQVKSNAYDGTSGTQATGGGGAAFTPSYAYAHAMTTAADVPALVRSSTGPQ